MSLTVFGEAPELAGVRLERLLVEAYYAHGELVSAANVTFLKASGQWYRLSLDAGTVHWRRQQEEPLPWSVPEQGWSYPHTDIGFEFGLTKTLIAEFTLSALGTGARAELRFLDGRRLVLFEQNDRTSYHVA